KLGLALRPGRRYVLFVSKSMRDAFGEQLASDFTHEFTAGPEDHTSPDVSKWTLRAPRAGTREPLEIDAGEPLDEPLFQRTFRIAHVGGQWGVVNGGTHWQFTPSHGWWAVDSPIHVSAELEALAGNRPRRLFELTTPAFVSRPPAVPVVRR